MVVEGLDAVAAVPTARMLLLLPSRAAKPKAHAHHLHTVVVVLAVVAVALTA